MVNEEMGEQKLYQFLSVPIATTPVLVSVIHRSQRSLAVVAGMNKRITTLKIKKYIYIHPSLKHYLFMKTSLNNVFHMTILAFIE